MAVQTAEVTDEIISICQAANVQLMDGTMWMHNERTALMQETIAARLEPSGLGPLKAVTATFCFAGQCATHMLDSAATSVQQACTCECLCIQAKCTCR